VRKFILPQIAQISTKGIKKCMVRIHGEHLIARAANEEKDKKLERR